MYFLYRAAFKAWTLAKTNMCENQISLKNIQTRGLSCVSHKKKKNPGTFRGNNGPEPRRGLVSGYRCNALGLNPALDSFTLLSNFYKNKCLSIFLIEYQKNECHFCFTYKYTHSSLSGNKTNIVHVIIYFYLKKLCYFSFPTTFKKGISEYS